MRRASLLGASLLLLFILGESLPARAQPGWHVIQTGFGPLEKILFTSNDTGYIIGYNGVGMRTMDGGASWKRMNFPAQVTTTSNLYDISFPSKEVGYIGGRINGRTLLMRTTDEGNSWIRLPLDSVDDVQYISFPSPRTGYITTGSGTTHGALAKTTDSGMTWQFIQDLDLTGFTRLAFRDELHGLYLLERGEPIDYHVYATSNGLVSTADVLDCLGTCNIYSPSYVTDQTWAIVRNEQINRSTDDGLNWTAVGPSLVDFRWLAFHGNVGYAVSAGGLGARVDKTTNGGITWDKHIVDSVKTSFSIDAPSDTVAYLLGSYDSSGVSGWRIWKTTDGGGPPSSVARNEQAPMPLHTIIASETTMIPGAQASKLSVQDLLGRPMAIPHAKQSDEGVTLDVRSYPPGVYFVIASSAVYRMIVIH